RSLPDALPIFDNIVGVDNDIELIVLLGESGQAFWVHLVEIATVLGLGKLPQTGAETLCRHRGPENPRHIPCASQIRPVGTYRGQIPGVMRDAMRLDVIG